MPRRALCAIFSLMVFALTPEPARAELGIVKKLKQWHTRFCNYLRGNVPEKPGNLSDRAKELCSGTTEWAVKQDVEPLEVFADVETHNLYKISTGSEEKPTEVFDVREVVGGLGTIWGRQFFRTSRPLTFLFDAKIGEGDAPTTLMKLERPFTWLRSKAWITNEAGERIGSIRQRHWSMIPHFSGRYSLRDANDKEFAQIKRKLFPRIGGRTKYEHVFEIIGENKQKLGEIRKEWSGIFKEMYTTADNFCVKLDTEAAKDLSPEQRAICLSAATLIDVVHFDAKPRRSGYSDHGSRIEIGGGSHRHGRDHRVGGDHGRSHRVGDHRGGGGGPRGGGPRVRIGG